MEHKILPEQQSLSSSVEMSSHEHNQIIAARLHALEEATSDLCWITTSDGRFHAEQTSWTLFTGQSSSQAMGNGWLDAIYPPDRKLLKIARFQCIQARQPRNIVCLLQSAAGCYRSLSIRCIPVRNVIGQVSEVLYSGTVLLPGQQQGIEKWLPRPEMEHLEALLIEMAHDAILVTDHTGRILSWNQGATNLYGYSAQEAIGQRALDLLKPYGQRQLSLGSFIHTLMRDGKWEGELEHTCRDGHSVTVDARFVLMRAENGLPLTVLEVSRDITGRKQTEQLLQEYVQLAEAVGEIGLWTWDPIQKQNVLSLPDKMIFPTFPHHKPGQPISYEQFLQLIHPDDRVTTDQAMREALEQQSDYINEFRVIDAKQDVLWYMAYGHTISDEEKNPVRMVGIVLNITERKHVEQVLMEANERVTAIIESITDSFVYLNKEWRYIYANSQACRSLGMSRDTLIGNVIWKVVPDLCNTIIEQKFRETMDERKGTIFDVFLASVGRWFTMRTYPAKEGITVFVTDITERIHMEETLRRSEAKFRRLVEANLCGVLVGDAEGHILEANDALLTLIGSTREDLDRGAINWRALTPPEYHQADHYALQQLQETGVCQPFEKEYLLPSGKRVPILISGTTLEENIKLHISFVVDLSKQKELEKQREHFLHLVSHELRTPLTAINGSLQLAHRRLLRAKPRMSWESEEVFNNIDEILLQSLQQTQVLNRLTNDLVESARITAEKLSLSLQPHNLIEIVRKTVEDMRFTMPERDIILEDTPQEGQVLVDAGRISQVLSNFISNALKYSPPEKSIAVGITFADQEVRVWVRDWGTGLSPEDQQLVWQRYFQSKSVQDRDSKSVNLGLGLYLCKLLIQQHNGSVGLESHLGQGSTFWFSLPMHMVHSL